MLSEDELKNVPVLVFANKQVSLVSLETVMFQLTDLVSRCSWNAGHGRSYFAGRDI